MAMPPGHPPLTPTAPADATVAEFVGLRAPKPASWVWRPPSQMRVANYTVPGQGGADAGELVVFFFGPGQGGAIQPNIDRWVGQFRAADGGAVEPKIEHLSVDEMKVTLVELAGSYMGMGMTAPADDTLFLAAIVEAPVGNVFIRLTGPSATVEANRADYMTMLNGLRRIGETQ
jgi:hypothetical protein